MALRTLALISPSPFKSNPRYIEYLGSGNQLLPTQRRTERRMECNAVSEMTFTEGFDDPHASCFSSSSTSSKHSSTAKSAPGSSGKRGGLSREELLQSGHLLISGLGWVHKSNMPQRRDLETYYRLRSLNHGKALRWAKTFFGTGIFVQEHRPGFWQRAASAVATVFKRTLSAVWRTLTCCMCAHYATVDDDFDEDEVSKTHLGHRVCFEPCYFCCEKNGIVGAFRPDLVIECENCK